MEKPHFRWVIHSTSCWKCEKKTEWGATEKDSRKDKGATKEERRAKLREKHQRNWRSNKEGEATEKKRGATEQIHQEKKDRRKEGNKKWKCALMTKIAKCKSHR